MSLKTRIGSSYMGSVGLGVYKASAEETRVFSEEILSRQSMKLQGFSSRCAFLTALSFLSSFPNTPPHRYQSVLSALQLGYRHVDTAQIYGNEEDVGRAVRDSGIPRSDVWITTKIWLSEFGYDKTLQSLQVSTKKLGGSPPDLVLLHAPGDPGLRADTWRALEDAKAKGLVREIGVSNFGIGHLEKLLGTARVVPAVNQLELHPFLQRKELVDYCKGKGIVLEAYSPLAKGGKLQDPTVVSLANKRGLTAAQVLVRWSLQKGFVPLPKSVHPERQKGNIDVFSFELSTEEMETLDSLEEGLVTGWDPVNDAPV